MQRVNTEHSSKTQRQRVFVLPIPRGWVGQQSLTHMSSQWPWGGTLPLTFVSEGISQTYCTSYVSTEPFTLWWYSYLVLFLIVVALSRRNLQESILLDNVYLAYPAHTTNKTWNLHLYARDHECMDYVEMTCTLIRWSKCESVNECTSGFWGRIPMKCRGESFRHRKGRSRMTSAAEDKFIRVTSLRSCSPIKCFTEFK